MWAVKNNMRSHINADKIKEFITDGYQIYSDKMELLEHPEDYAVDSLEVKGEWKP